MGFFSSIFKPINNIISEVVSWFIDIPDEPDFGDQQSGFTVNKQSNIANIPVIYGERLVGGTRVFVATSGSDNEYLYIALVLCEGEVDSIGDVYINDVISTDDQFDGLVTINKYTGTDSQTADTTFVDASIGWTSDHRLRGLAYMAIRLKYDRDAFSGIPTITAVVRGKKVFDPRTSTTAWSDNPALCLRDYLTNTRYGKGLSTSLLDNQSFEDAADACETLVSKYTGAGSTEAIFQCNAILDTSESLFANVQKLLRGMRGLMPYSNGVYSVIVEDDADSSFDFDTTNIVGGIQVVTTPKNQRYNKVTAKFANPATNWQEDSVIWPEAGSTEETNFLNADNNIELSTEITLPTITDYYAARDIARILCLASRQQTLTVSIVATSEALQCAVGDIVTLTHPTPAWSSKEFRVTSLQLMAEGEVRVALQEHDATIYPWVTDAEANAVQQSTLPNPFSVGVPTNLTVTPAASVNEDGTSIPVVEVSWTATADQFVDEYEVQYSKDSGSYKSVLTRQTSATISPAYPDSTYDVRVRSINSIGARSAFVTASQQTAVGDTGVPSAPTNLTATAGYGSITLDWDNPSDRDLDVVEIHEGTSSVQGNAVLIATTKGSQFTRGGLSDGVTRYYWVKAVDYSGNKSGFNSPTGVSATTQIPADPTRFVGRIEVVSSLTTGLGLGDAGKVEFLTTNETLYKWNGTAWVTGVVIEDDVGTILAQHISVTQLDAITANMGTITAGKMQNADQSFIVDLDNKKIFIS